MGYPQSIFRPPQLLLNTAYFNRAKLEINAPEKAYLKQYKFMPKIIF